LAKINQASNSVFAMMLSFSVFLVTFMDFWAFAMTDSVISKTVNNKFKLWTRSCKFNLQVSRN
jgi:hypothetical protein